MRLGIVLAPGESLAVLRESGQDERFLKYYIPQYERAFEHISLFSYAAESHVISTKTSVVPNRHYLNRFLYLALMPFLTPLGTCDVIRVTQATSILPAVLAKCLFGSRVVVTYGYDYVAFAKAEEKQLLAFLLPYYLHLLRFADAVIVTTQDLKITIKPFAGSARVVLIPNGVDLDFFTPSKKQKGPPWNVLYVGRMEPTKNVDTLIRAVASTDCASEIHLTCVGSGSKRAKLLGLAKQLGVKARFTGAVPHTKLPLLLKEAHVFVLISSAEGHPKALIEALGAGLPCLVSEEAGRAVGIRDGEEGVTVAVEVPEVARALYALLSMRSLGVMGKKARALAATHFDLKKLLGRETDLLISLCLR